MPRSLATFDPHAFNDVFGVGYGMQYRLRPPDEMLKDNPKLTFEIDDAQRCPLMGI
jgi:hypothetical protein